MGYVSYSDDVSDRRDDDEHANHARVSTTLQARARATRPVAAARPATQGRSEYVRRLDTAVRQLTAEKDKLVRENRRLRSKQRATTSHLDQLKRENLRLRQQVSAMRRTPVEGEKAG